MSLYDAVVVGAGPAGAVAAERLAAATIAGDRPLSSVRPRRVVGAGQFDISQSGQ